MKKTAGENAEHLIIPCDGSRGLMLAVPILFCDFEVQTVYVPNFWSSCGRKTKNKSGFLSGTPRECTGTLASEGFPAVFHSKSLKSIEKTKIKSVQNKNKNYKKAPSIKSVLTFRRYVSSRVLWGIHQSWAQHWWIILLQRLLCGHR